MIKDLNIVMLRNTKRSKFGDTESSERAFTKVRFFKISLYSLRYMETLKNEWSG